MAETFAELTSRQLGEMMDAARHDKYFAADMFADAMKDEYTHGRQPDFKDMDMVQDNVSLTLDRFGLYRDDVTADPALEAGLYMAVKDVYGDRAQEALEQLDEGPDGLFGRIIDDGGEVYVEQSEQGGFTMDDVTHSIADAAGERDDAAAGSRASLSLEER